MTRRRRKNKKMQQRRVLIAGIAAGVLLIVGAIVSFRYLSDNKIPNFRKSAVVFVYPETTLDEVYAHIINEAGVKRPYSLRRALKSKRVEEYMQPGRYEIRPSYTSVYVARMLNNCWQSPAKLVLSGNIRHNSQLARKISSQLMIDSVDVVRALESGPFLSQFGVIPQTVFSLFMPDTYEMFWTASMEDVLRSQKKAYDAYWTKERVAKARAQGLTPAEVSVLASIVREETNYEPEMPRIAGVYLNRLHKGMKLQADPTVAFCHDYTLGRILRKHLAVDSPYNTYKYAGLPPGPISVPTRACLEAVLNPEGDALYFCANSTFDGSHLFAKSYSDHLKNARAFQRALTLRQKTSPAK